ncbi:LuxR C-terminal-related transcriptional regulator [Pseudomonas sp. Z8(2022)]|uniref:LuxR C-terminal-related transcriptional regulator n=1 Tax=Pseudomonas sp. Z8(2022) TaxID=2962597 RepID=UPI0021F3EA6A|nr:LuxR C-terminal-related transcriptional regulator [Pseudomonas sp. Z8(2022)]UYP30447.1 LuxR C-terminal-related transcriptional regulator [Pseudomonas sp. Z8(2022)]
MHTVQRGAGSSATEAASRGSRFRPPRLMQALLPRPHLVQQIIDNLGSVSVLIGPPGGGRTVLMNECYQELAAAGEPVCWVNLSYADNDPATLHQHLSHAFALPDSSSQDLLPEMPAGVSGFIDGVHWLENREALDRLQNFVLSVAANGRIVLAASQLKAHNLRRAELGGVIRVIGPSQLRMRDDEAAALIGGQYSREQIGQLNTLVDGWPAGLRFLQRAPQFCAQYLANPQSPPALPEELADYFETHICQGMSPARLDALMELSVLQRFIPELVAALPGAVSHWGLIDELLREGWMIRYADSRQRWACVSPALGLYLATRLSRFNPQRYRELKYFVARWLGEQGYAKEAVLHAVALDQPPVAARLIEDAGAVALDLGRGPNIQLSELLPVEQAGEFPLLFISQVYQRVRAGRLREARSLFEQAWQQTEGFTRVSSSAAGQEVQSWAQLYRVVFLCIVDSPITPAMLDEMQAEVDRLLVTEPVLAASWGSVLAYGYLDQRRFEEAVAAADVGLNLAPQDDRPRISIFLHIHKAHALLALGRLESACACAQAAFADALTDAGPNTYEWLAASLTRGLLHHLCGEDQQALDLLLPALAQVRNTSGWVPLYAEAYAAAVASLARQGGLAAAQPLLDQAEVFAHERGLVRLIALLKIVRLLERIRAGHWREALLLQQSDGVENLLHSQPVSAYELSIHVPAVLASAYLMLEINRPAAAADYLARLDEEMMRGESCRWQLSYHLLLARAHFMTRRYSLALEHTFATYRLSARSGLRRTLGPGFAGLVEIAGWAVARGRELPEGMQQWLEQVAPASATSTPAIAGQQLLSPRESEVMLLVAEGLTNKEIAARLAISEGTVKGHRKRIHEKFGVSSRSQAISRARELLLI